MESRTIVECTFHTGNKHIFKLYNCVLVVFGKWFKVVGMQLINCCLIERETLFKYISCHVERGKRL